MSLSWSTEVALAEIPALQIQCEECGHTKRMPNCELRAIAERGIPTPQQLKPKLKCSQCGRRSIYLLPVLRAAE